MTGSPKRIQLRRTRGWRKPEGAVVVARPSKWGNPFVVGGPVTVYADDTEAGYDFTFDGMTAEQAVAGFRDLMQMRLNLLDGEEHDPDTVEHVAEWRAALEDLRGHELACWCPLDQPCHADVLLELANR